MNPEQTQDRFDRAIRRFDEVNSLDPRHETEGGIAHSRELLYARRLTEWVVRLQPAASEALRLAARCQHLGRWEIAREQYAEGRAGYLKWRRDLQEFHARRSAEILTEVGYDAGTIARVASLNLKRNLATDPECQTLEDALCLVFLEHQLLELAARTDEATILTALRKSWAKMSPQGRAVALELRLPIRERDLLQQALAGNEEGKP